MVSKASLRVAQATQLEAEVEKAVAHSASLLERAEAAEETFGEEKQSLHAKVI